MKYSEAMVTKILNLYATGKYTIAEICKTVKINEDTFYTWKKEKSEFSEALKKADEFKRGNLKDMALSGLAKLLNGYEYTEKKKAFNTITGETETTTNKFIMPNATAVIFTLCNLDPDNFKQKNHVDHTTDGDKINEVRFTVRRNQETQPDGD